MEFLTHAETWVGVGTLIFFGLLLWQRVPAMIGKTLDARSAQIAKELDDARRLREEAQELLEQYRRKQADAEKEAQGILTAARAEAEAYSKEMRVQIAQAIERRSKQAQDKIAQAEAAALAEVRALAADAAVSAAEKLIAERLDDKRAQDMVQSALKEIPGKLN